MTIIQCNPVVPVETPKGSGNAHFLIEYGMEHHLHWVVFIDETGECWTFENPDIRLQHNLTNKREKVEHKWDKIWNKKSGT